jgi:hypothetical protein
MGRIPEDDYRMTDSLRIDENVQLHTAVVVSVSETDCRTWSSGGLASITFAPQFPAPRMERVSPGHLVAVATAPDGRSVVVWRWYDVVILHGEAGTSLRLWEPGHGEVDARGNAHYRPRNPGSRAYASAGLRGGDWWVSGPIVDNPGDAAVELDEVRALYDVNHMWSSAFETSR